jgi:hypothetical protein
LLLQRPNDRKVANTTAYKEFMQNVTTYTEARDKVAKARNVTEGYPPQLFPNFESIMKVAPLPYREAASMDAQENILTRELNTNLNITQIQTKFILNCIFDRLDCSLTAANPQYFANIRYGACFTFGTQLTAQNVSLYPWATRYLGSNYGLRLTLDLQTANYEGEFASRVGARVTVHHPATVPHPEITGFTAMPGTETAVGIHATRVHRMPAPYPSNCSGDFPAEYY